MGCSVLDKTAGILEEGAVWCWVRHGMAERGVAGEGGGEDGCGMGYYPIVLFYEKIIRLNVTRLWVFNGGLHGRIRGCV